MFIIQLLRILGTSRYFEKLFKPNLAGSGGEAPLHPVNFAL